MSSEHKSKFYKAAKIYAESLQRADHYSYAMDCVEGLLDNTGIPVKRSMLKLSRTGTDYAEQKAANGIRSRMIRIFTDTNTK